MYNISHTPGSSIHGSPYKPHSIKKTDCRLTFKKYIYTTIYAKGRAIVESPKVMMDVSGIAVIVKPDRIPLRYMIDPRMAPTSKTLQAKHVFPLRSVLLQRILAGGITTCHLEDV